MYPVLCIGRSLLEEVNQVNVHLASCTLTGVTNLLISTVTAAAAAADADAAALTTATARTQHRYHLVFSLSYTTTESFG